MTAPTYTTTDEQAAYNEVQRSYHATSYLRLRSHLVSIEFVAMWQSWAMQSGDADLSALTQAAADAVRAVNDRARALLAESETIQSKGEGENE